MAVLARMDANGCAGKNGRLQRLGSHAALLLPSAQPAEQRALEEAATHSMGQDSHPCWALKRPAWDLFFAALVSSPLHVPGRLLPESPHPGSQQQGL